jgi:hypothetical protein
MDDSSRPQTEAVYRGRDLKGLGGANRVQKRLFYLEYNRCGPVSLQRHHQNLQRAINKQRELR